ncbi:MAG TPA: SDR family oxidoreductase [Polyangiaceae bacterium]|jgi:nucleoside-diphosphate-sugar epimerase|nr:SDR family oxidoreductase [Polyangiaceae bacterium]
MRVFVTGASGHIGLPVVRDLLTAGHKVVGLARSEASAQKIASAGAEVLRNTLDDLDRLQDAARNADGVIHLAFKHDLAFQGGDFAGALAADLRAVEAIGEALAGSGKPFVNTTGTMLLAHSVRGRAGTEDDAGQEGGNPRVASENLSLAIAKCGVRTSIMRLAPTVHSSLDHHGFIPMLVAAARKIGFAAYVGDGSARWPAVHTLDAARLYRLALEAAPAGSRVHAAAEEGVPFRSIAEAIGRGLHVPAKSVSPEKAGESFGGFLGMITQLDNPTSSARTRELLGWKPAHPGLIADIAEGHYFASPASK